MGNFKFGREQIKLTGQFVDPGRIENFNRIPQVNFRNIVQFEPMRTNRFIVHTMGLEIPPPQIYRYELSMSEGEYMIDLSIYDFINFTLNPNLISQITGFVIEYLDPTGIVVNTLVLSVINCMEFSKSGDYENEDITSNEIKFRVNIV